MGALKLTITNWGEVALDKRGVAKLMRSAGNDIKTKTARGLARAVGGGRIYRGGGGAAYRGAYRPGPYQASAPGDWPVRVSNSLQRSLAVRVLPSGEGFMVRARQFYALFLEAGARGGGNPYGGRGLRVRPRARERRHRGTGGVRTLSPRPILSRTMRQEEPNLQRRVRTALDQALTWRETKAAI
ncbi:MAG TPA: hypothetical protein VLN57_19430 [Xanthobacteraceae bacterium]|nr:hypothetical protein [Xanthobacteraceae bacterium]